MTVAIHQPNYLPWLGYFYKIFAADVFVIHDAVAFTKSSYTKRCQIRKEKSSHEVTWLSLPVRAHSEGTRIDRIEISPKRNWDKQHFRKIENTYAGAPYFNEYGVWLRQIMNRASEEMYISRCNENLIREIADMLGIRASFVRSSAMSITESGSALNLEIVKFLDGDKYLAGMGSYKYEDAESFRTAGVDLVRHDFGSWLGTHPYDQGTDVFSAGVSVVDALMHIGADSIRTMFEEYQHHVS